MRYRILTGEQVIYDSFDKSERLCVKPNLKRALNDAGTLTFTLLPGHLLYNSLKKLRSYVSAYFDDEQVFFGRVLISDTELDGQREFTCEGSMTFFLDSEMEKGTYTETIAEFMQRCLDAHNAQVEEIKQFQLGLVTADKAVEIDPKTGSTIKIEFKIEGYSNTRSVLESLITSKYGGFFRIRFNPNGRPYLDYIQTYGRTNTQRIKIAENIIDKTDHVSGENVFTVLRPIGSKDITIEGLTKIDMTGLLVGVCEETQENYHQLPTELDAAVEYKLNIRSSSQLTNINIGTTTQAGSTTLVQTIAEHVTIKANETKSYLFTPSSQSHYLWIPAASGITVTAEIREFNLELNTSNVRETLFCSATKDSEGLWQLGEIPYRNNKYRLRIYALEESTDVDIYLNPGDDAPSQEPILIESDVTFEEGSINDYTFTAPEGIQSILIDNADDAVSRVDLYSVFTIDGGGKLLIKDLYDDYGYILKTESFGDIDDKKMLLKAAEDLIARYGSQLPSTCSIGFVDFHILNPNIMRVDIGDEFENIEGFPGEMLTVGELETDLEDPANDNLVFKNREEIAVNDPSSTSGSLSASYASKCQHIDHIYKYITEEENKLTLMTDDIKIVAHDQLQLSSIVSYFTSNKFYMIADETEVDDPDHPGQKKKVPGEISLIAKSYSSGEETEVKVALGNVSVTNANLEVDGYVKASELEADIIEAITGYAGTLFVGGNILANGAIGCSSITIDGVNYSAHTHGIVCSVNGNEVTITSGVPGANNSDSFFLDSSFRTATGLAYPIVLSGSYQDYSNCIITNMLVDYDDDTESTMARIVVDASAVYQAGRSAAISDARSTAEWVCVGGHGQQLYDDSLDVYVYAWVEYSREQRYSLPQS